VLPGFLLDAARERLESILARGESGREIALDLLVADALTTYAFEAASESPDGGRALATEAMRTLSSVATNSR
jgi:hypothetical protein